MLAKSTSAEDFDSPFAARPAPKIPDHELLRCIGQGSYGEVWLGRSVVGTLRAIKIVYRATFEEQRPFEREFSGIQKFEPISRSAEGLVHILQIGRNEQQGYFYYVMELADDAAAQGPESRHAPIQSDNYLPRTLGVEKQRRGRLTAEECVRLGASLAVALDQLHRNGLIHRDIKPSNIVFIKGAPKLADIGLVAEFSEARSYVGTEGFIPPEGPNSPQADIYSLGKVLYEVAMGKDRQDYPEPCSELAESPDRKLLVELNSVILKACEPDVDRRYKSARQMYDDLILLEKGKSVREKRRREKRLRVSTVAAAAITVVALIAVGVDRLLDVRVQSLQGQGNPIRPALIGKVEPRSLSAPRQTIDLSAYYTAPLIEAWYPGPRENTLLAMPKGLQTFAGVKFDTRGLVQLSGKEIESYGSNPYPHRVRGIAIDRWVKRLHFLHGTLSEVSDGAQVGGYHVEYRSGRSVEIPIIYGRDLRALWQPADSSGSVSNSEVAWTGQNASTRERNMALRVYKRTWENPRPDDQIIDVDFHSAMGNSAPFLVALSWDEHEPPPGQKNPPPNIIQTLQSKAASFPVLGTSAVGPCQFTQLRLNQHPIQIGDKYYDGFRFTVPSGQTTDLVWAFEQSSNLNWSGWYVLPMHGRLKVGFEDWYHGVRATGKESTAAPGLGLQYLNGKKLQPGREYFIWFAFENSQAGDLSAALRFVPAGELNPNNPETLVHRMGLEDFVGGEKMSFHRHYCLGAIR